MTFKLYSNCKIVHGFTRSSICDLQKRKLYILPIKIAKSIENGVSVSIYKQSELLSEWINELKECKLGFWTDNPHYFPEITDDWDSPEFINNAIIEADYICVDDFKNIIAQLNKLFCKFVEIRFYKEGDISRFIPTLNTFRKGYLRGITTYLPFSENNLNISNKLLNKFPLTRQFVLHSCDEHQIKLEKNNSQKLFLTEEALNNSSHCGNINSEYFAINLNNFTESKNYNSCLNKKISIDVNGNIKNCPSMTESYGNIKNTTLEDAINKSGFKKYWNITKDDIAVCKDCEFRYICTDCRAYTERTKYSDEGLDLSKPLKCGYNPYTNKWSDWNTDPEKKLQIEFYKYNN